MGDIQTAIEDFTRAIQYRPNYVVALNSRGELLLEGRDWEAARDDFRQALAVDPEHVAAKKISIL
jgi:tetratricopeptide (TPR) repeat protein